MEITVHPPIESDFRPRPPRRLVRKRRPPEVERAIARSIAGPFVGSDLDRAAPGFAVTFVAEQERLAGRAAGLLTDGGEGRNRRLTAHAALKILPPHDGKREQI